MYPSHIITLARSYVHENARTKAFSESDKMQYLNDAVKMLTFEARQQCPYFGLVSTTVTQTVAVHYSDIPAWTDRILRVFDDSDHSDEKLPADFCDQYSEGFALSDTQFWWIADDRTKTWTLYCTKVPWECHIGVAGTTGATSMILATDGAATTIGNVWTGARFNDYYNDAYIYIRVATANSGQQAKITDYAGATYTATVASWPGSTPTAAITYEIQPIINPIEWKSLLAWEVALMMMKIGRDEAIDDRRHPYARLRRAFVDKYANPQMRMGSVIRFNAPE